jgi:hypothetical protein
MKGLSCMAELLSPAQRRTEAARQAFAAKFRTPEEQREYFRSLGRRSAAGRVVLSASDAATLADAYRLLGTIFERTQPGDGVVREEAAGVA